MRYFLTKTGLEHITVSEKELCKMIVINGDKSVPTHLDIKPLLANNNIIFKHPSVTDEELCDITGDNGNSACTIFNITDVADSNAEEDITMVVSSIKAKKDRNFDILSMQVNFMNLVTSIHMNNLLRNRAIDDILITL